MRDYMILFILGIIILFGGGAYYFTNLSSPATVPSNNFSTSATEPLNNHSTQEVGHLKVHPSNPRYFTDGTGRIIYLTGSHSSRTFKDIGETDPPKPFDFDAYLDLLKQHNHNFIRLWTWELSKYTYPSFGGTFYYVEPFPWSRTGPGTALDGKPKFDLSQFNQSYFDRLRSRVVAAEKRGIYVSIMLFEGHALHASLKPWCWDGHPFSIQNNVNGINGDPDGDGRGLETHTLEIPAITALQEAYVRKVIDTVNDLDNVLYEIANESGNYSTKWQYHIIRYIHEYERDKPKQHPVGMTFQWASGYVGTNKNLFDSPADWISPFARGVDYRGNPQAADGRKVVILDTDHLWGNNRVTGGVELNRVWVWKSFCRGLNPILLDHLEAWEENIRDNMGYTLAYANQMNLTAMVPHNDLASTKYCLANPGFEYLVYLPNGGNVWVDLTDASGQLAVEWLNPSNGEKMSGGEITGGVQQEFTAPFSGDAVLYIVS